MGAAQHLPTEPAACALCGPGPLAPLAAGEDFEYRTSGDTWHMPRCGRCGLLVLSPRPAADQFDRIYPPGYHAFAFTPERFGLAHVVRRRLEAARLLRAFAGLPADARVLDVGCGDGFHLRLLRDFGPGWQVLGVDPSERANRRAAAAGLPVRVGTVETLPAADGRFDAALMVMTVEHLADPLATVRAVRDRLTPGGRLVVVTDDAGSPDARLFGRRHWGGYHFPRHTYLFDRRTLRRLGERAGFRVRQVRTLVSPVNWVYSLRNTLVDCGGPRWLIDRLSLESAPALAAGTVLDFGCQLLGRGAVLQGVFVNP